MEFKYIAIAICLILTIVFFVQEWRRPNRARLGWRLAATGIAMTCFALFIVPITYKVQKPERLNEINLLSPGVSKAQVDGLKGRTVTSDRQLYQSLKIPGLTLITDLPYFLQSEPGINHLNIYGYGLSKDQLQELKDYQLDFYPAAGPKGLISASWNSRLKNTEQLSLQGTYQHVGKLPVKLLLQGLGTPMDSLMIKTEGENTFSLKARPRQSGKAVYHLIVMQDKDTLSKEPLALEVKPAKPLRILMLAAHPDFEYKFLKEWFFEKQYPVILRSRISKDKYSTDFLNSERTNVNRIDKGLLNKTDLLIIDEEEMSMLSGSELGAINTAVDLGLGLLVRISMQKPGTAISKYFNRYESPALKNKSLTVGFSEGKHFFNPLPFEQTLLIRSGPEDQPIVVEKTGKVLVNSRISGMGRLTGSVIPATYHWLLNGQDTDYADFWSEVLTQTARKAPLEESWYMEPAIPSPRQKLTVTVEQALVEKVPVIAINGGKLSPLQNIELPFQWQATAWATDRGWNTLHLNGKTEFFYVYGNEDWEEQRNTIKLKNTSAFVNAQKLNVKSLETSVLVNKQISLWWFFIPFLLAVTFLWYETKML